MLISSQLLYRNSQYDEQVSPYSVSRSVTVERKLGLLEGDRDASHSSVIKDNRRADTKTLVKLPSNPGPVYRVSRI